MSSTSNAHYALKGDLTTGSVNRLLVRLTVPMIWGIAALISFQLADMYFLSKLGPDPLVAIGFTFPVTMVVLSLTIAMGIATSSLISRAIGAGRIEEARRLATQIILIAACIGFVIWLAGTLLIDPVFRAMGASPKIMPLIRQFMMILYVGYIFQSVQTVGNFIMRAQGDARSPALILIVAALVNLALDPILIFGLFGLPRLEMQGAAIANVISYVIATLASLYILIVRKKLIARVYLNAQDLRDTLRRFATIAIPVGIANIIQPVTSGVITGMLAAQGHSAVAAFGIVSRIEAFAFIIMMALSSALGPIIGQNWGAGAYARVNETLKNAFAFTIAWSVLVALALALYGEPIARLFTNEPDILHATLLYFWIVPVTYAFGNLVNGWGSAFNAMGLPKNAFMLIVVRLLLLTLPLAWLGGRFYGAPGIFAGIAAANVLSGAGSYIIGWRIVRRHQAQ